jgi:hypothetical protein
MKPKTDYNIIQVYLDAFKLDNLYEKYPIVIYDQIYNVDDLLNTIFKYSYAFKTTLQIEAAKIYKNTHKYLLVFNNTEPIKLKVINPKYKKDIKMKLEDSNVEYVTIKLKEKQVVILPALWYYYSDNQNISAIGLDDLISRFVYAL